MFGWLVIDNKLQKLSDIDITMTHFDSIRGMLPNPLGYVGNWFTGRNVRLYSPDLLVADLYTQYSAVSNLHTMFFTG